jgi:hypothetical protein
MTVGGVGGWGVMPWLAVVATIHADVGTASGCDEEGGGGGVELTSETRSAAGTRAKRLAGGSYTAARAERRARARGCADRAGPLGGEGGEGVRRARGRGPNGPKGENRRGQLGFFGFSYLFMSF